MITESNLAEALATIGFTREGTLLVKTVGSSRIEVDVKNRTIKYPEDAGFKVNNRQTCNFESNENFVVLECVARLLDKGYRPQHIELEPKWKVGHGSSGGRADILISDNNGRPLLLIECKLPGQEFKKAWNKTLQDGAQLFAYAQQIIETQFLALYASGYCNESIHYTSHIIAHRDNDKYLADNLNLKGFRLATDVKERFTVWKETYKLDYTTKGVFEENILAYEIGKDKYTISDLHAISASDQQKKYHEFATVLRQHNVSGRENAFDKLVNLFLCKLVDEIQNPLDLKFNWKGVAYDTHFELMDRLQQLYQAGMSTFLGEEITYINQGDVSNALRFSRHNADATQRAVWNLFVQQKFFTNNDFSFIDVHNEKLFYQNADVLLKLMQMWQDVRLTSPDGHNQFLGDMFEGFLDQGVKQSEGQFFTPTPICRFILMCLPLKSQLTQKGRPPKAIDYACGAGHFLTELALQIQDLLGTTQSTQELAEYYSSLYGIEKEYRLSKVAKVSAFMYGHKEINICYGDGLLKRHASFPDIRDSTFDMLIANPPYSVKGFLETLPEPDRKSYMLSGTINDLETANSIEAFFIERAKQLLRTDGVAAIVLPSSILSHSGATHSKARAILLQHFDVVAIVEFGSGTFGKTGTNTVTLFLRRKGTSPEAAIHYNDRISEWILGESSDAQKNETYQDSHIVLNYASHIGVPSDQYIKFLRGEPPEELRVHPHFASYEKGFAGSLPAKALASRRILKMKEADRIAEASRRFFAFALLAEREKLLHFALASEQPNEVLIVRSPEDTKSMRDFLGYEWSAAKGNEGIKIKKDNSGRHLTPLYDETNRNNSEKLNFYISRNFEGDRIVLPETLESVARMARLVDLIDFSKGSFDKQIQLAVHSSLGSNSKWPLQKVSDLVEIISGGTPDTNRPDYWGGDIPWLSVADFSTVERFVGTADKRITALGLENSATKQLLPGDIIISARGTVGAMAQLTVPMAFNQSCYGLRSKSELPNAFIFYALSREIRQLKSQSTGSKFKAITMTTFDDVKLPVPPQEVVNEVVRECELIDASDAAIAAEGVPISDIREEKNRRREAVLARLLDNAPL